MKFINIGYGNMVAVERIVTLVSPDSAPIKRLIQDAKDDGRVIDVTCGRKTRAVIITDSEHVILPPSRPRPSPTAWRATVTSLWTRKSPRTRPDPPEKRFIIKGDKP